MKNNRIKEVMGLAANTVGNSVKKAFPKIKSAMIKIAIEIGMDVLENASNYAKKKKEELKKKINEK